MKWLIILSAIAAPVCYNLNDIKNAVCQALCRHDGADEGPKTEHMGPFVAP